MFDLHNGDSLTHVETPQPAGAEVASLEQPLIDFQNAWAIGDTPRAEEWFAKHPSLLDRDEAALRVIYEEVCQRRERGEAVTFGELYNRFPKWHTQIHSLLDVRSSDSFSGETTSQSLGFRAVTIVTELGRGAGGRVYLARQPELSNRLIVLKVNDGDDFEHLTLARLQHTNIVPLYGVVANETATQRALCMPYFGATTLHHILAELHSTPPADRTAAQVLEILEAREKKLNLPETSGKTRTPSWRGESFVQMMCRIGAALAQALADAHQANLLHLDIKPSNILITTDGVPMLLDFHLARAPLEPGSPPPRLFGGSLPFMSPEQNRVCRDVEVSRPVTVAVDARADIYSLGMLLCVAVTDGPPPDGSPIGEYLRSRNRAISVGLADLVERCLAPDPAKRYANARNLAEDLRRHSNNEPLAHIPNRSWSERWRKWRRRRPHALAFWTLIVLLTAALGGGGLLMDHSFVSRRQAAETMFFQGQIQLQEGRFAAATEAFGQASETLPSASGDSNLRRAIDQGLATAHRAKYVKQLSDVVDAMRLALLTGETDYRSLLVFEVNSRALWEQRDAILNDRRAPFDHRLMESIKRELTDLAIDRAELLPRIAPLEKRQEYAEKAHAFLEEARSLSPSPRVIEWWRSGRLDALPEVRSPWESYMLGRVLWRNNEIERARDAFQQSVHREPASYWSNFALALCEERLGHGDAAVAAYSVCVGLRPQSDTAYTRRGQTFLTTHQWDNAIADFDRSLQLRPNIAAVHIKRGEACLHAGKLPQAIRDFRDALEQGADPEVVSPLLKRAESRMTKS